MPTKKTVYPNTTNATPLSPLTRIGDTLYTAGQVGIDPETRSVPDGIRAQTRQVLLNMRGVLALAGADLTHVVKTSPSSTRPTASSSRSTRPRAAPWASPRSHGPT